MKKHILILSVFYHANLVLCADIPVIKRESHIANQTIYQCLCRSVAEWRDYYVDYNKFLDEPLTSDQWQLLDTAAYLYVKSEKIIADTKRKESSLYEDQLSLAADVFEKSEMPAALKSDVKILVEWQLVLRQACFSCDHDPVLPNCNDKPHLAKAFFRFYNRDDRKEILPLIIASLLPRIAPGSQDISLPPEQSLIVLEQYITDGIDASFIRSNFLHRASRHGLSALVEPLARINYNMNGYARIHGLAIDFTPLHIAAYFNQIDCLEELARHGADVNAAFPIAPLSLAANEGHIDAVKTLLKLKADPNKQDNNERAPVYYAIKRGHVPIVDLLLRSGATLDASDLDDVSTICKNVPQERVDDITALITACKEDDPITRTALELKYYMRD